MLRSGMKRLRRSVSVRSPSPPPSILSPSIPGSPFFSATPRLPGSACSTPCDSPRRIRGVEGGVESTSSSPGRRPRPSHGHRREGRDGGEGRRRASSTTHSYGGQPGSTGGVISRSVMHKLQFARGIGQRDLLRANTLPSITRARLGCFARLHIYEENARFALISFLLLLYLCLGAVLFHILERETELKERKEFKEESEKLRRELCNGSASCLERLDTLLALNAQATMSGVSSERDRFDLAGAFFFSGTVISTIGFGTATPRTLLGRTATILYGVVGCTCCVLFFNLFLERLITAFSYVLRYFHEKKVKRRMILASNNKPITLLVNNEDYAESASSCEAVDNWRPSVYKVFFCLLTLSALLISTAAFIYSCVEEWHFIDSLYFCFISFATIGFGDYVSNQKEVTINKDFYRLINFILLTLGACCFYCLFNVSSIVVRQLLNWMIKKMDIKIDEDFLCFKKPRRYMGLGLRPPKGWDMCSERSSIDCQTDGLLSLKEFLMNNHSSVVMLQKHLIKSALKNVRDKEEDEQKISASRVGPMGILQQAFGDE